MGKIVFLIFAFVPLLGLTQDTAYYQLQYRDKPNYKETNHMLIDSIWRFQQTVTYDEATMLDEETWTRLEIQIKDTTAFLKRRIIDFSNPGVIARYEFDGLSTNWSNPFERDSTTIAGLVQLLSVTSEGILVKLNITVTVLKTKTRFIYTGERMFYKFNLPPLLRN